VRLVEPSVRRETSFLTRRGLTLSPAAKGFQGFLKGYVSDWESRTRLSRGKPRSVSAATSR
jgi:hypothetical protein